MCKETTVKLISLQLSTLNERCEVTKPKSDSEGEKQRKGWFNTSPSNDLWTAFAIVIKHLLLVNMFVCVNAVSWKSELEHIASIEIKMFPAI